MPGSCERIVTAHEVRATIAKLAAERGVSLAGTSRMIRRNEAYLQRFVKRGTPVWLAEDDRLLLARFFSVNDRLLGARDPWQPVVDRRAWRVG
jgi:hypothetical protein